MKWGMKLLGEKKMFHEKSCDRCKMVHEMIMRAQEIDNVVESVRTYLGNLVVLAELTQQAELILYAGDCPIEDVEAHVEKEERYTINHYFQCVACGEFFYIGFCCRGGVVFKEAKNVEHIDFYTGFANEEKLGRFFELK